VEVCSACITEGWSSTSVEQAGACSCVQPSVIQALHTSTSPSPLLPSPLLSSPHLTHLTHLTHLSPLHTSLSRAAPISSKQTSDTNPATSIICGRARSKPEVHTPHTHLTHTSHTPHTPHTPHTHTSHTPHSSHLTHLPCTLPPPHERHQSCKIQLYVGGRAASPRYKHLTPKPPHPHTHNPSPNHTQQAASKRHQSCKAHHQINYYNN
jgi:hypothetical protein